MYEVHREKPTKRAYLDGELIFEYYDVLNPKNFGEFVISWEENRNKATLEYNGKKYKGTAWLGYNEGIESLYFLTGKVKVFNG